MNTKQKPLLGVIGGMGPLASALFLEDIANLTMANKDQDHLDIILYSMPSIPARSDYILGKTTNSPLPFLIKYIKELQKKQVDLVAIPCVTAMHFYPDLCELGVNVTNIATIALQAANDKLGKAGKIGIMATSGTISSNLLTSDTKNKYILPDTNHQNMIMDVIYTAIKSGNQFNADSFDKITTHLQNAGAEIIILGCTELSFVKRHMHLNETLFIDALGELAKYCIRELGKEVKTD